jgi:hypothetical protein
MKASGFEKSSSGMQPNKSFRVIKGVRAGDGSTAGRDDLEPSLSLIRSSYLYLGDFSSSGGIELPSVLRSAEDEKSGSSFSVFVGKLHVS